MALHPDFPDDPHAILDPSIRWFPADEALWTTSLEKLLPPLAPTLRKEVKAWRDSGYDGATETSKSLLRWWFGWLALLRSPTGVPLLRSLRRSSAGPCPLTACEQAVARRVTLN